MHSNHPAGDADSIQNCNSVVSEIKNLFSHCFYSISFRYFECLWSVLYWEQWGVLGLALKSSHQLQVLGMSAQFLTSGGTQAQWYPGQVTDDASQVELVDLRSLGSVGKRQSLSWQFKGSGSNTRGKPEMRVSLIGGEDRKAKVPNSYLSRTKQR